jgi:hypothetical protein
MDMSFVLGVSIIARVQPLLASRRMDRSSSYPSATRSTLGSGSDRRPRQFATVP